MEKSITSNQPLDVSSNKFFSYIKSHGWHILTIATCLAVVFIYVWYCSYEQWTSWPLHTRFYYPLASGFAQGSLALAEDPAPAILALSNPYDPKERRNMEFPMDYSIYDGKYYLYFGPVPAIPYVILKLLGSGLIGDQYLVFAGVLLVFLFQSLLILWIRNRFFPTIPAWVVPICIFFAGLIAPLGRLLTDGRVYETAISWGAGFFLGGFYFLITALERQDRPTGRLVAAGACLALAVGSRITQALPVAVVSIMLILFAIRTYTQTRSFSKSFHPLVMMGLPLALGAVVLGWYNWARFGDMFETGISYQMTTPDLQGYRDVLYSPLYIPANTYNYIAAAPEVSKTFPFLKSVRGNGHLRFPQFKLPKVYYTRSMTGILYSTPFVVLAGISVLSFPFLKKKRDEDLSKPETDYLLKWIIVSLLGSFLVAFLLNLSFFWVETRYFLDFTPPLVLLSIIGFWLACRSLALWTLPYWGFLLAGIGLMALSVLVSNLVLFSNQATVYQDKFPELWNFLSNVSAKIVEIIP